MMRTRGTLILAGTLLLGASPRLRGENITLTSSYPVPVGIYNQIVTTGDSGPAAADTVLARNKGNVVLVPASNPRGGVGIGTDQPATSALLELNSNSKGFLPPRMTTSQRDAMNPVRGLLIYSLSDDEYQFFDGTGWRGIGGARKVRIWNKSLPEAEHLVKPPERNFLALSFRTAGGPARVLAKVGGGAKHDATLCAKLLVDGQPVDEGCQGSGANDGFNVNFSLEHTLELAPGTHTVTLRAWKRGDDKLVLRPGHTRLTVTEL